MKIITLKTILISVTASLACNSFGVFTSVGEEKLREINQMRLSGISVQDILHELAKRKLHSYKKTLLKNVFGSLWQAVQKMRFSI